MRRLLPFGIVLVLVIAAGATLFLSRRTPTAPVVDLRATLPGLDAAIAGGYLSTAREILSSLALPAAEVDQISLLKRAFQVGRESGDFSLLADLAVRALAKNGGSQRLRTIAAYGNLRAGRLAEAEKILGRTGVAGRDGQLLMGEALLRRGAKWSGSDDLTRELLALEQTESSAAFAGAALRAGDKRLSLDAALLAMKQGSQSSVLQLVHSELGDSRFAEAAGLMLYDAGDVQGAALRMQRIVQEKPGVPAVGLALADMLFSQGNTVESERWLLRTLPLAPSLSWTPYFDLAFFSMGRGESEAAVRRLEDGLAFFPRSRELRLMLARVDIKAGNLRTAESLLAGLLSDRPSDGEAALLLLSLQSPGMAPEASRARLWNLFDLVPSDAEVFDTLASSLIAARDWEGMKIAVRQHQASGGEPDARLLSFQGVAAAMSGDDAGSLSAFRRAALLAKDGKNRFNLALVLLRRGDTRGALQELEAAFNEAQEIGASNERALLISRIETLRGAALLLEGDTPGAGSSLTRALAIDPGNLRAGLLLRKLEAGGQ